MTPSRLVCRSIAIRALSVLVVAIALGSAGAVAATGRDERPNVVLILSDDQGWGDVRSHGNDLIETPHLDRLAADGARFERFFVCPLCAPTRASLLTGRYHLRTGATWVTHRKEVMRAEEVTLAEVLKAAGYATACIGKWHNGAQYPHHPNGQGFDEFIGFRGGHCNDYVDPVLDRNLGKPLQTQGFVTDVLTDAAIAFVEERREVPFFLYLPYNAPHAPFQVPQADYDRCRKRGLDDKLSLVYGLVENLDANIGRLLKRLDELALADRTIVVFLTDNGPNGQRFNGGMKGTKGSPHEGGVRVPCFVRWPGRIAPGTTIAPIAAHIDLFPTLAALCGAKPPDGVTLDGVDLSPLLFRKSTDWPQRTLFEVGAVRTQRYRLVGPELFDLIDDPGQQRNVTAAHPALVRDLQAQYDAWHREVSTGTKDMPPPISVGHAVAPVVELPAPDGKIAGPLKYNHGPGWAHAWIQNWTTTDARIEWELDVVAAGTHWVDLSYTCNVGDVGTEMKIDVAGRSLSATIEKVFSPIIVVGAKGYAGAGNPDKPFATLDFGRVELPRGRTTLRLQATRIPGREACELQGVRLTRVE